MKKTLVMVAVVAAATFAFVGCKKEKTTEEKLTEAVEAAGKDAAKMVEEAQKAALEAAQKLEQEMKK